MYRAVVLAALAASSCAFLMEPLPSPDIRQQRYASVRIQVECPEGAGVGSGFAVSPRHVITARHVIECDEGLVTKVEARLSDGTLIEMAVDEIADVDAARLVVVGVSSPFTHYALPGKDPVEDQYVCTVGGRMRSEHSVRKCGWVASVGEFWHTSDWKAWPHDKFFHPGIRVVRGNSGSPVFDEGGRVVGIAVSWSGPMGDHWGGALIVSSFRHLWVNPPPPMPE